MALSITAIRLRAAPPTNQISTAGRRKKFFGSPKLPVQFWAHPASWAVGTDTLFLRGGVKAAGA